MLPSDVKHLAVDSNGDAFATDGGRCIALLKGGWLVNLALLPSETRVSSIAGLPGGGVAIADTWLNRIWKMDASGQIRSVAGVEQPPGLHSRVLRTDGPLAEAHFRSPSALASGPDDDVFVAEPGGDRPVIRTISRGSVTSAEIAGMPATPASGLSCVDGTLYAVFGAEGLPAVVLLHRDLAIDASGNHGDWKLKSIVGSRTERGSTDGPAATARFVALLAVAANHSECVVVDGARLRRIARGGHTTTLAGSTPGYLDARGSLARFGHLQALAARSDGGFLVADPENDAIRLASIDGDVTTVIGALRSERILPSDVAVLSRSFGNALVDDDVREAWGIARVFLRDHRLGGETWPDRTLQPTSVASARLGKELAEMWSRDANPERSGVGAYCHWLIACEERALGVNEIRDHRLLRAGRELNDRAG